MRAHRNDVYRARRSRGKVWPVLLWILAGLIVLAVILFYAGQKYIVYDSDGSLHVVFPIMETPAPVTEGGQPETVDTEVVLEDPDYSGIISDAGKDLSELHAQYLTADKITPEGLTRAAASAKAAGGNALVLQMKSPGGTLSWKSGVSEASAYGVNGTAELADALQTVKGQNIYLVAVVSTCVDSLMAERYAATALQTASGSAYTDGSGGWVDPYNTFIRTYLVSLCKELRELGFDEVAFSYLQQPLAAAELKYADQTGSPSRTDAVVALAKYLRANLTATGLRVSAIVSADSILQKQAELSGQDMTVLPKLFDRVCVFATADNVASLRSVIAADSSFDAATRFVPFLAKRRSRAAMSPPAERRPIPIQERPARPQRPRRLDFSQLCQRTKYRALPDCGSVLSIQIVPQIYGSSVLFSVQPAIPKSHPCHACCFVDIEVLIRACITAKHHDILAVRFTVTCHIHAVRELFCHTPIHTFCGSSCLRFIGHIFRYCPLRRSGARRWDSTLRRDRAHNCRCRRIIGRCIFCAASRQHCDHSHRGNYAADLFFHSSLRIPFFL